MKTAFFIGSVCGLLLTSCGAEPPEPAPSTRAMAFASLDPHAEVRAYDLRTDAPRREVPSIRRVIKSATLECEVHDYQAASAAMVRSVIALHGFVVSSTARSDRGRPRGGTFSAHLPTDAFEAMLDSIEACAAEILVRTIDGEDVTEEYVDLTARLRSKRLLETRFLDILRAARSVKDLLEVERSLEAVREEIERLEGRMKYLDDRTMMATILVELREPAPKVAASIPGFWDRISDALRRGGAEFATVLGLLITYVIASMPVILFLGLVVFLAGRGVRWGRRVYGGSRL